MHTQPDPVPVSTVHKSRKPRQGSPKKGGPSRHARRHTHPRRDVRRVDDHRTREMRLISPIVTVSRLARRVDGTHDDGHRRRGCDWHPRQHATRKVHAFATTSSGGDAADDLVSKLRRGDGGSSSLSSIDDADGTAKERRARRRENRDRDAVTKAMLALALGAASMMPTVTTEAPVPSPVVSGAKRTVVAGAVKNAASDARSSRDERTALNAFERDVERFVGGSINL